MGKEGEPPFIPEEAKKETPQQEQTDRRRGVDSEKWTEVNRAIAGFQQRTHELQEDMGQAERRRTWDGTEGKTEEAIQELTYAQKQGHLEYVDPKAYNTLGDAEALVTLANEILEAHLKGHNISQTDVVIRLGHIVSQAGLELVTREEYQRLRGTDQQEEITEAEHTENVIELEEYRANRPQPPQEDK